MTSQKNKIAIIIPYFGQWPEWIDLHFLFLRTKFYLLTGYSLQIVQIPKTHSTNFKFLFFFF